MRVLLAHMVRLLSHETKHNFFFFLEMKLLISSISLKKVNLEGEHLLETIFFVIMASGLRGSTGNVVGVDRLRDEMKDMKIRGDKVNDMSSSFHSFSAFHFSNLHLINF